MPHQVLCLLLVLRLAAGENIQRDTTKAIKMKVIQPNENELESGTLQLKCTFDRSRSDLKRLTNLTIYESTLGTETMTEVLVACDDRDYFGEVYCSSQAEINCSYIYNEKAETSELGVTWMSQQDGYCRSYVCRADGLTPDHQEKSIYKAIKVKTANGYSRCPSNHREDATKNEEEEEKSKAELVAKVNQCYSSLADIQSNTDSIVELREKVLYLLDSQNNLTKQLAQQRQDVIQTKLSLIDTTNFKVSSLFGEQTVFIVSKDARTINGLHEENELCKNKGGYLAELDNREEQQFVADFLITLSFPTGFIGANDIDREGSFFHYNSKKPVENLRWLSGEPNNAGGKEDCVAIHDNGLNDIKCDETETRIVCEIPLLQ